MEYLAYYITHNNALSFTH